MRTTLARLATTGLVCLIMVGCSPAPTTSPSPSGSAAPSSAASASTPAASPPQSACCRAGVDVHGDRSRDVPGPWICPRARDAGPDGSGARREPVRHDPDNGRIDPDDPRQGGRAARGMADLRRRRDTMRPAPPGLGWLCPGRLHPDRAQWGRAQPDRRLRVRCERPACSLAGRSRSTGPPWRHG